MNLEPNTCANCNRVIGYVAPGTLLLPTFCVICASDLEVMNDWGHKLRLKGEKPIIEVLQCYNRDSRRRLNELEK